MYFEVFVSPDDERSKSYVRKETLLELYIKADTFADACMKLERFKKEFPHPRYAHPPQRLWSVYGWLLFGALPKEHDMLWRVFRWDDTDVPFHARSAVHTEISEQ